MNTQNRNEINLNEIFSSEEIELIQKESIYVIDEDNTLIGKQIIPRDKLTKVLFKILKGKLKTNNLEEYIPLLNWLEKDRNIILDNYMKYQQKEIEDNKQYLKWIDDNCIIKFKRLNFNKNLFNGTYRPQNITLKDIKKIVQARSKTNELNQIKNNKNHISTNHNNTSSNTSQINHQNKFYQISEKTVSTIDDPDFDIFKLEKEVGAENTLTVVGSYIYSVNGFYSFINHKKFEKYINLITKGYIRENPYHNVYIK